MIYCIQNHDQVGNRALGDRLNHRFRAGRLPGGLGAAAAEPLYAAALYGPGVGRHNAIPLFHRSWAELGRLVTEGRRAEFAGFTRFAAEQVNRSPGPRDRFRAQSCAGRSATRCRTPACCGSTAIC